MLLSSAADLSRRFFRGGEALPEEANAILIITQQPACLAQRRTGLPKKEKSFVLACAVDKECRQACTYRTVTHSKGYCFLRRWSL
jgi:hypothetical protein